MILELKTSAAMLTAAMTYNNNYPVASGSTIVGSVSYRR